MPNKSTRSRTVPPTESIVQAKIAPDSELHMLIGGPYVAGGEEHRYGHTALRIKTPDRDTTYEFGRYGRVTGDFGAEGEGILRVSTSFPKYIAGENALGRTTKGFVYRVFSQHVSPVFSFYDALIAAGERMPAKERGRSWLQVYKLTRNYHALSHNCTTLSLDGIKQILPRYEAGAEEHIDPAAVLSFSERVALKVAGTPSRLFLPANLQSFLSASPPVRVDRIDTYP